MGYMTYPGYYGYSAGNTLIVIFALLLKLFAFVLFIAVAVGIVMWIRNAYFDNSMRQKPEYENDKSSVDTPIIKTAAYIGAVILGLLIICSLINRVGGYGMGYGYGMSPAFTIAAILIFIIKVLAVFLVISLIMAAVALAKEQSGRGKPNTFGEERR